MYTRSSNRRPVTPPADYSGVLFDSKEQPVQHQEKPTAVERNVRLPLATPDLYQYEDSSPRYPLNRRRPQYRLIEDTDEDNRPLGGLFDNKIPDELLLAALIMLMIENGSERNTIVLLGFLLI